MRKRKIEFVEGKMRAVDGLGELRSRDHLLIQNARSRTWEEFGEVGNVGAQRADVCVMRHAPSNSNMHVPIPLL